MTAPIRPGQMPIPAAPAPKPAVTAAQRAFFQAALNQTAAVEPERPQPAPRTAPVRGADPERPTRPGSLLDIRV